MPFGIKPVLRMRVKQNLLPRGYSLYTAGYRTSWGTPVWKLWHGKYIEVGQYDDRDVAIKAAWRDAGRWHRLDLRKPEQAGRAPEVVRSEWLEDVARLRTARKSARIGGKRRHAAQSIGKLTAEVGRMLKA
jgi:hypothetical protein